MKCRVADFWDNFDKHEIGIRNRNSIELVVPRFTPDVPSNSYDVGSPDSNFSGNGGYIVDNESIANNRSNKKKKKKKKRIVIHHDDRSGLDL